MAAAVSGPGRARAIQVARQESAEGSWEIVRGAPDARLAGIVRSYVAYHERTVVPGRRQRELPGPAIPFILELGPTLRLYDARGVRAAALPGGFVAGPDETFTTTELDGHEQRGIQIDCSFEGAQAIFGVPLAALAGHIIGVGDLFGAEVAELRERIEGCAPGDWHARFALVDRFFLRRVAVWREACRPAGAAWLTWVWQAIESAGGNVSIDQLARSVGYSRKHVTTCFRERFGLAPKPLARLVRFDRAVRLLRAGAGRGSLAQVAAECGYFDQAHFIRDFRRYAGGTPGEYAVPWPAEA
jgi:AraC-like DNA-binding protein